MGRLHIFFIAAFAIRLVGSLPQPLLDWNLMDSSDSLAYDTSSLLSADSSDGSNIFSSNSVFPMDSPSIDWNSNDLASLPLDSGALPGTLTTGDDMLWDDSSYSLAPDIVASGCSGIFGKRSGAGASCAATREESPDPCGPDKEAMCCSPTWMFRSRWEGGGFNMDGCVKLVLPEACLSSGGSVQCCTPQANILNTNRMGCTISTTVPGNIQPQAPAPKVPEEPTYPPTPGIPELEPVPGQAPVPELQPIPMGTGF